MHDNPNHQSLGTLLQILGGAMVSGVHYLAQAFGLFLLAFGAFMQFDSNRIRREELAVRRAELAPRSRPRPEPEGKEKPCTPDS